MRHHGITVETKMAAFLRFHDLQKRGIVNNRVTLKRWQDREGFPRGIKLGPNTRVWAEDEIEAYLAKRRQQTETA
jgi:predicted DNA-binding transcriptional regulator AlpA